MSSVRQRVVSDLSSAEFSGFCITTFIFDTLISDDRFDKLLFLLFPDMTMEERKVIPCWKIIVALCRDVDIDICVFLDIPLIDLIETIKKNISNGNININKNLLGFGEHKIYTSSKQSCISSWFSSDTIFLICYMKNIFNESPEIVNSVIWAIETYESNHDKDVRPWCTEAEINLLIDMQDYCLFEYQQMINLIHEHNTIMLMSSLRNYKKHDFAIKEIENAEMSLEKPQGEMIYNLFTTISILPQYDRLYLTNHRGFRDMVDDLLHLDMIEVMNCGEYKKIIYLNETVKKIKKVNIFNTFIETIIDGL